MVRSPNEKCYCMSSGGHYFLIWYLFIFRYRHIPKAKATAIADTPELKRIAENTKIQSNVQYHADFERQKGKLTQVMCNVCIDTQLTKNLRFRSIRFKKVADDPETLRIKQNTKHISNVEYHGDAAKKAAMEKQREVTEVADNRGNYYFFHVVALILQNTELLLFVYQFLCLHKTSRFSFEIEDRCSIL